MITIALGQSREIVNSDVNDVARETNVKDSPDTVWPDSTSFVDGLWTRSGEW